MAEINGIEGLSISEVGKLVDQGGKFVTYSYCISIIIMTFQRSTDIYFIKPGASGIPHSLGYTILTLILGWWGIPWGPIYTIGALYKNITGGEDLTKEVMNSFIAQAMTANQTNTPAQQPTS